MLDAPLTAKAAWLLAVAPWNGTRLPIVGVPRVHWYLYSVHIPMGVMNITNELETLLAERLVSSDPTNLYSTMNNLATFRRAIAGDATLTPAVMLLASTIGSTVPLWGRVTSIET